ncbi:Hypothetical protein NTJ_07905 [Nesidiocoris tenuis]|uniref:Uncharacterized protein n=1 Tax=Nesidiocoris tenuis TaxID=355587 RepID=A0ABN7ASA7_9HEMI|nr:Hypothetical protein NTJ_07905 [Nesidiocoris tenuis]
MEDEIKEWNDGFPFLPFASIRSDLLNLVNILSTDKSNLCIEGIITATFLLVFVFSYIVTRMRQGETPTNPRHTP